MRKTEVSGNLIKDGSIQRKDIDVTTTGQSLITKVIAGSGVILSSTGGDSGTGDVTISATYAELQGNNIWLKWRDAEDLFYLDTCKIDDANNLLINADKESSQIFFQLSKTNALSITTESNLRAHATDFVLHGCTTNGSDTQSISITASDATSSFASRSASVQIFGNQHIALPGDLVLTSGNVSCSRIVLNSSATDGILDLRVAGTSVLSVRSGLVTVQAGVEQSSNIFEVRGGSGVRLFTVAQDGECILSNQRIRNVMSPYYESDVATKGYVDSVAAVPPIPSVLDDLTNVSAGSPQNNDVLTFFATDGGEWRPAALSTVATSGSYNDLTNQPSLFSGSFNDLTNTPYMFSSNFLNGDFLRWSSANQQWEGANFDSITDNLALVASTGSYTDLNNKPQLFSGAYEDLTGTPFLATVATSGSYSDLSNKPTLASFATLTSPSNGQVLQYNGIAWVNGVALTSLNGLTGASQTLEVGTSSPIGWSSSGTTHTLNIPDAGSSARGVVTTGTQTFAGAKTFSSDLIANGLVGINEASPGAQLQVTSGSASRKALVVKAAASATVNIFEVQNSSGTIHAAVDSAGQLQIRAQVSDTDGTGTDQGQLYIYDTDNASSGLLLGYRYQAGVTEYARIQVRSGNNLVLQGGGGKVGIGRIPTGDSGLNINITSSFLVRSQSTGTTNTTHYAFSNGNGDVGFINTSGSGTAFQTTSDYRLKENIVTLSNALERVGILKPRRFNFKVDPLLVVDGFIAHELQSVIPECVSGIKDEVKEDGSIKPQAVDYSRLTPLLTAAIQELSAKVVALEQKVAILENQAVK